MPSPIAKQRHLPEGKCFWKKSPPAVYGLIVLPTFCGTFSMPPTESFLKLPAEEVYFKKTLSSKMAYIKVNHCFMVLPSRFALFES